MMLRGALNSGEHSLGETSNDDGCAQQRPIPGFTAGGPPQPPEFQVPRLSDQGLIHNTTEPRRRCRAVLV